MAKGDGMTTLEFPSIIAIRLGGNGADVADVGLDMLAEGSPTLLMVETEENMLTGGLSVVGDTNRLCSGAITAGG